ncbi:MAG: hypothetical protein RL011_2457 [Pseudomonadota bacterium]
MNFRIVKPHLAASASKVAYNTLEGHILVSSPMGGMLNGAKGGSSMIAIFPEIVATAAAGDIERLAILVRKYFGAAETRAPKIDVARLIESAGLSVRRLSIDAHGALLAKDERGIFQIAIVLHPHLAAAASQFMMAHMLGRYLLEVQPLIARGDWQASGFQEKDCALTRYAQGRSGGGASAQASRSVAAADAFAAALLLPSAMLERAIVRLQDHGKVASFFGVNQALVRRRLGDLKISTPEPVNFLDAENRAGIAPPEPTTAEPEAAASQLVPPEPTMPRAYAASTYGSTEKMTRQKSVKDEAPVSAQTQERQAKGMERLREIARKLDKGVGNGR